MVRPRAESLQLDVFNALHETRAVPLKVCEDGFFFPKNLFGKGVGQGLS